MRLKSSRENPTFEILTQSDSSRFRPRSSTPFQIRQLKELEDADIQHQKIMQVKHPAIPPWFTPEADICAKQIKKKDCPEEEIRHKFLEHDIVHRNEKKIYTDGSKSKDGVGCAVVCEGESYVKKLPDFSSIFTAEATAIADALELIQIKKFRSTVIYSDSKSVLDALKKFNPTHPLIQKAQEWLFYHSVRHRKIKFCWIPSHIGIEGNEVADREAKEAITCDFLTKKVPHLDMCPAIRTYILRKWQQRWMSPLLYTNRKYRGIKENISFWNSCCHSNRRFEVVLTRLRIGHTCLTHNYILEGSSAPVCAHCSVSLSVEHILVHCPQYDRLRSKHFLTGKPLSEILGECVDVDHLMSFLKAANVFNEM